MPEDTPEQVEKKVMLGEDYMARMAGKAKRTRFINGMIFTGIGLTDIVLYFSDRDGMRGFLYSGFMFTAIGVATLFIKNHVEDEYERFKEWKATELGVKKSFHFNAVPLAKGGMINFAMRF